MEYVYSSADPLEAHMLVHMLQQQGIRAEVHGEELQGGIGGLPVSDYIKIAVAESDYQQARTFITEWDAKNQQSKLSGVFARNSAPTHTNALLLCLIIGLVIGYLVGKSNTATIAQTSHSLIEEIDQNHDRKPDLVYHYTKADDLYPISSEQDLNFDGTFDIITQYNLDGSIASDESDFDFDGRKETSAIYKNSLMSKSMSDYDGDGNFDVISAHSNGVPTHTYFFDAKSNTPVKKNVYNAYMLTSADFDSDNDGVYDTRYTFDNFEQIIKTEKINKSAADFLK